MAADPLQHHGNRRADVIQIVPVRQSAVREVILVPADGVKTALRPLRMVCKKFAAAGDQLIHGASAGNRRFIARLRQLHEMNMTVVEARYYGTPLAVNAAAAGAGEREDFRV